MNRRGFLAGLLASTALPVLPAPALSHLEGRTVIAMIPYPEPSPALISTIDAIRIYREEIIACWGVPSRLMAPE